MNPNFDSIGKQFVEQYYLVFDNREIRSQVAAMYHPSDSLLTFEGQQFQGVEAIAEKMKTIPIDNMFRQITTIDCQPTVDGGVLVNVIGQLKNNSENDKVLGFSQTFILKPANNSFYTKHEYLNSVINQPEGKGTLNCKLSFYGSQCEKFGKAVILMRRSPSESNGKLLTYNAYKYHNE